VIVHPAGAVTCTVPEARGRAAVSSTITGCAAPCTNSSTFEVNRSETGGDDVQSAAVRSIRRCRLSREHECLPADVEYVLDRQDGRILGKADERRIVHCARPGVPSLRSQYGWLGGVPTGIV
jgi:hypothetical protein